MGFHMLDFFIVAAIGLALFGPKAFQSMARSAGKGVAQVKDAKEKIMAELPMDDITRMTESIPHIPQVPTSPQQALRMLMTSEQKAEPKKETETKVAGQPVETKIDA